MNTYLKQLNIQIKIDENLTTKYSSILNLV